MLQKRGRPGQAPARTVRDVVQNEGINVDFHAAGEVQAELVEKLLLQPSSRVVAAVLNNRKARKEQALPGKPPRQIRVLGQDNDRGFAEDEKAIQVVAVGKRIRADDRVEFVVVKKP